MDDEYAFFLALFFLVCATMITLGCTLLGVINAQHRRNCEREFKEKLLDRGLSVDEITKLVEATPLPSGGIDRYIATMGRKNK